MKSLLVIRRIPWIALALLLLSSPGWSKPPEEGDCPALSRVPGDRSSSEDAGPILLKEGMLIDHENLLALRQVIPAEIWQHREVFFHEGMQMTIGPCHRRYTQPLFFRSATKSFAGRSKLNEEGDLILDHPGLPFPPDSIDPEAEDAAMRWAWNMERRYRGAGHQGSFRVTDLPGRVGGIQVYEGKFFLLQTSNRSDLPDQGFQIEDGEESLWVSGGRFTDPFNARHLSWRQFRPRRSLDSFDVSDDIFVYVPSMRKMRRAASTWADGIFFPRYSVGTDGAGGGLSFGTSSGINPTAGASIAATEDARAGFTGLNVRPNAYVWRIRGEQDVLAPINSTVPGYPENPNRNFGRTGLSVATDQWDVRRAVVIEGALRRTDETIRAITVYIDYQTQLPLYWVSRTDGRRLVEIGILVHRFSEDVRGYPSFVGGVPAEVFDPVAAVFYNALEGGGGWRRESYDIVSTSFTKDQRRRANSTDSLGRGK